jgi:uncharacterized protein YegL
MNENMASSNATAETATVTSDFTLVDAMDVDGDIPPALTLSVSPRHDSIGLGTNLTTTQVCATIKARDLPDEQRAPVDIVVALDVSGSMTGNKLQQCKKTLELLMRVLLPRDRFGLVSFACEAILEIPAQNMTTQNKEAALQKIKALHTRGTTNISAAIGLASQEINMIENPNEVRSIFLLTDGHANNGITEPEGIVAATKNCLDEGVSVMEMDITEDLTQSRNNRGFKILFKKRSNEPSTSDPPANVTVKDENAKPPISLHCLGYGTDHDSDFLRQIASATPGGTYYFVENDSNVGSAFGDALAGILSVVAQNAVVNIQVPTENPSLEIVNVHHARQVKRENGSYSVTIGDFYAEETRDVVFEVSLATPIEGASSRIPHAEITVAFMDAIQKRPVKSGPMVCYVDRPKGNELSEANHHVLVQWLRIYATEQMTEADKLAKVNLGAARARIQEAVGRIKSTPGIQRTDPLIVQLIAELNQVLQGLSSQAQYASTGAHYTHRTIQCHSMQRCSEATYESATVYRGSAKMAMAKAFKEGTDS